MDARGVKCNLGNPVNSVEKRIMTEIERREFLHRTFLNGTGAVLAGTGGLGILCSETAHAFVRNKNSALWKFSH